MSEMKTCIKCGEEKPKTNEYFQPRKDSKDGFRGQCRDCRIIRDHKYYEENKITMNAQARQYVLDNKEVVADYLRQYAKNNKEHLSNYSKQYSKTNKEHLSEYSKGYRELNKPTISENKRQYFIKHREPLLIYAKSYREANPVAVAERKRRHAKKYPEKRQLWHQTRRTLKKNSPSTLTLKQWEDIKIKFSHRCAYCGEDKRLTMEHFVPVSKMGELTTNNVLPVCAFCNTSKGNRDFFEWYPKFKYYSKISETAILKFLNYKNGIQQLALL